MGRAASVVVRTAHRGIPRDSPTRATARCSARECPHHRRPGLRARTPHGDRDRRPVRRGAALRRGTVGPHPARLGGRRQAVAPTRRSTERPRRPRRGRRQCRGYRRGASARRMVDPHAIPRARPPRRPRLVGRGRCAGHAVVGRAVAAPGPLLPAVPRLDRVVIRHHAHHVARHGPARGHAVGGLRRRARRADMARWLGAGDNPRPHPGLGDRGRCRPCRPVAEEHAVPGLPCRRPAHRCRARLDGAHGRGAGHRGTRPAGRARWPARSAAQYAQVRPHPATSPRPGGRLRSRCAHGPRRPATSPRATRRRGRDDGRRGGGGMADGDGDARPRPIVRRHSRLLGGGGAMAGGGVP